MTLHSLYYLYKNQNINRMKKLIYSFLIIVALVSCSKNENHIDSKSQILGEWDLMYAAPILLLKKKSFNSGKSDLAITGIRLDGKWGQSIAGWDDEATVEFKYSLTDQNRTLTIIYEDDVILDFDILKLDEKTLMIQSRFGEQEPYLLHFMRSI